MNTVIDFSAYKKPSANVTETIFTRASNDYENTMREYSFDGSYAVAADIALIKFLMRGAAHRVSGESHPSQKILDSVHENLK
jgi:hypothetical protein